MSVDPWSTPERRALRGIGGAEEHGGQGGDLVDVVTALEAMRHYRDVRILGLGGGATEVLAHLAGRLLGYAAGTR